MTHRKHNQRTAPTSPSNIWMVWPRPWLAGPFAPQTKKAPGAGRWALGVGITQPAGFRELREMRPAAGSRRSIRSRNFRSVWVTSAWGSWLGFWRGGGRTFTSVIAVGPLAPAMSDPIDFQSRSFYPTGLVRETTHGAVGSEEGWKLVFLTLQTDRQDSAKANSAHASSCFPLLFVSDVCITPTKYPTTA
ncbi:hypothetical protein EDB84DRAFT_1440722 [Lactarius hengduanensis]|nr:hypothetical protein EDB84DRAFT_1440722 [Lactarius hengduanensis]